MTDERSIIFLNSMGDVEVSWDKENDDVMREVIQRKMDQGITFFIVEPVFFNLFTRKKKLKSLDELGSTRIRVDDGDLEDLFATGKIHVHRTSSSERLETVKVATSPQEVIQKKTVATKQFVGG